MDMWEAFSGANVRFMLDGFYVTLRVAFFSIVFSFLIGTIVGTLRYMKLPVIEPLLAAAVELIRNLPLLLIIFFTFLALPELGIKLGAERSAIAALSVFEGAMISEVVRGGLLSVDKGQLEAARSSGLGYGRTLWHIVLPQGLRRMVPPIVSQFISLLKDTSLATVIALPELMHHAKIVVAQNLNFTVPVLVFAALLYFGTNYLLSLVSRRLEHKGV